MFFVNVTFSVKESVTGPVLFRGMSHNVSWSLGGSVADMLLEALLAPEPSLCASSGSPCHNRPAVPFHRSTLEDTHDVHHVLLKCGRHDLVGLNDTLCADILAAPGGGFPTSVLALCQALSSLSSSQVEQVWSNACYGIQALLSPFLGGSPDCTVEPDMSPPSETVPLPISAPHRVVREASNLKQLACNYSSWLENRASESVLVSLCSDNEREEFVKRVCSNALLMRKLLSDQVNSWLYGYCANSSADPAYLVDQFCVYEHWVHQPTVPVDPALVEFCLSLDGPRLIKLICEHTGFFMLLFSNPENGRFLPNCTVVPLPPTLPDGGSLMSGSCRYSEWRNVTQISVDLLSQCIRLDHGGFTQEICSNKTFLNSLLLNKANAWLEHHCDTSLSPPPPEPTQRLDIAGWCDYHTWGERQVDDSVVGLCWQYDQLAFHKNVCCKASVLEKLLQNPQNQWLTSVCPNTQGIKDIIVLPQVSICLNDL